MLSCQTSEQGWLGGLRFQHVHSPPDFSRTAQVQVYFIHSWALKDFLFRRKKELSKEVEPCKRWNSNSSASPNTDSFRFAACIPIQVCAAAACSCGVLCFSASQDVPAAGHHHLLLRSSFTLAAPNCSHSPTQELKLHFGGLFKRIHPPAHTHASQDTDFRWWHLQVCEIRSEWRRRKEKIQLCNAWRRSVSERWGGSLGGKIGNQT